jgi:hypothetical protein
MKVNDFYVREHGWEGLYIKKTMRINVYLQSHIHELTELIPFTIVARH